MGCLCTKTQALTVHRDVTGDVEAPKVDAAEAPTEGNVQEVDFKNLSAEEAFQVLGVSAWQHMQQWAVFMSCCAPTAIHGALLQSRSLSLL